MMESSNDVVSETSAADCEALSGRGLDAAVAEKIMGWSEILMWSFGSAGSGLPPGYSKEDHYKRRALPLYSTDLNAAFEAQARCIEMVGLGLYEKCLYETSLDDFVAANKRLPYSDESKMLTTVATAEQRCRAVLKAIQQKGDQ